MKKCFNLRSPRRKNPGNETIEGQNPTAGEPENKVVFTKFKNLCLQIDEDSRKLDGEDLFVHEDEEANAANEGKNDDTGGWMEVKETSEDEMPDSEDQEEVDPDETIREVVVGKGLSSALNFLKIKQLLKKLLNVVAETCTKRKADWLG